MLRASWAARFHDIPMGEYDLTKRAHEDVVGHGCVIMFFEARIRPMPSVEGEYHRLAVIEEYWPLPPDACKGEAQANRDILSTEFGCHQLYAGSPARIYTVMRVECILGPAHIVPDPVHLTIPHASEKAAHLVHGRADSSAGSGSGSELVRLNRWTMTWGSQGALRERDWKGPP